MLFPEGGSREELQAWNDHSEAALGTTESSKRYR
jgi:hypothetical protein